MSETNFWYMNKGDKSASTLRQGCVKLPHNFKLKFLCSSQQERDALRDLINASDYSAAGFTTRMLSALIPLVTTSYPLAPRSFQFHNWSFKWWAPNLTSFEVPVRAIR